MLDYWDVHVENLVEGLAKHETTMNVDKNLFYSVLMSNNPDLDLSSTYFPLLNANKSQEFNNNILTIDGIIHNSRAEEVSHNHRSLQIRNSDARKPSILDNIKNLLSKSSEYSTYDVLKDLMSQDEIIQIMMSKPHMSFSLLGNLKYIECDGNDKGVIYTRPVLVRPRADYKAECLIHSWEVANIKVEKEKKYFGIIVL